MIVPTKEHYQPIVSDHIAQLLLQVNPPWAGKDAHSIVDFAS
jgi:hypothetical protein